MLWHTISRHYQPATVADRIQLSTATDLLWDLWKDDRFRGCGVRVTWFYRSPITSTAAVATIASLYMPAASQLACAQAGWGHWISLAIDTTLNYRLAEPLRGGGSFAATLPWKRTDRLFATQHTTSKIKANDSQNILFTVCSVVWLSIRWFSSLCRWLSLLYFAVKWRRCER